MSFGGMNPGEAIELLDNDLSNNGENGYDGIASRVEAIGNISNLNGWIWPANVDCSSSDTHGEGHGLLFQAATVEICDLIVSGNECAYNRRNGIYLAGGAQTGYRNARISNNTVQNNGTEQSAACVGYGVRLGTNLQQPWCPPAQVTPMLEVVFISNVGGGNYDGNWNLPYPGVSESQHPIPQNVVATDTSRCEGGTQIHEITLTWTNPTQDKLIQIWRDGQHIRNASAGTTQFVNKVGPCAQHWYELRYEIDPGVFGPFSNFAAAQTPFNPCNPSQQCQ